MTVQEAKDMIIKQYESEARLESAQKLRTIEDELNEKSNLMAKEVTGLKSIKQSLQLPNYQSVILLFWKLNPLKPGRNLIYPQICKRFLIMKRTFSNYGWMLPQKHDGIGYAGYSQQRILTHETDESLYWLTNLKKVTNGLAVSIATYALIHMYLTVVFY